MKQGYHSTQEKAFKTVPRSEFLGIALGYAGGMILSGIFPSVSQWGLEILCCGTGFVLGWLYDRKFCLEKDEPTELTEQLEAQADDKIA